jgi:hypothetical protein
MKPINKRYLGIQVLAIICGLVVSGVALAAIITINHQGSVEIVAPPQAPLTYGFKIYDAAAGGNELAEGNSAFFALGQVQTGGVVTKTVYLQRTGTGSLVVTPSYLWGGTTVSGQIAFSPTTVSLNNDNRQPLQVTFTAGSSVVAPNNFSISYSATY